MSDLSEQKLTALAQHLLYPPTSIMRRRTVRYSTWLSRAAMVLLVIGLSALAVPDIRARVMDMLQLGAVQIYIETPDYSGEPLTLDNLNGAISLAATLERSTTLYTIGNRLPDRVFVQDGDLHILVWLDGGTIEYALYQIPQQNWFAIKGASSFEATFVDGQQAIWIDEPHRVQFIRDDTREAVFAHLVTGNVLIWNDGQISLRLETGQSLESAIALAETLRPLNNNSED